jgi:Tol biopolymer transport system component
VKKRIALLILFAGGLVTSASSAAPNTTYRAGVYAVRGDGSGRHLVAEPHPAVSGFTRSLDGRSILFNELVNNETPLFAADVTGTNRVRLTPPGMSAPYQSAALSPDGQTIAFSKLTLCGFRCGQYALYLVSRDGTNLRLVDEHGYAPSWSPDGGRLAFASWYGIYVLDLSAGTVSRVARDGGGPLWAPRGERIAYIAVHDGYGVACFVNADGSRRRCTHPGHTLTSLRWSRDGKRVAFRQTIPRRIGVVDADARRVKSLGFFGPMAQPASFSPDGHRLAIGFGSHGSFSGPVMTVPVSGPPHARRLFNQPGALSDLRWRTTGLTYVASIPDEP